MNQHQDHHTTPRHLAEHPQPAAGRLRRWWPALAAGLAGAVTVTVLNEGARRLVPHAPRIEVIGERALSGSLEAAGLRSPRGASLYRWTLAGDLLSNSLYYALVGAGDARLSLRRGGSLGFAAGLGAVLLPRPLGLGRQPGARAPVTPLLTMAWYLAGGLVSAATYRRLGPTD